MHQVLPSLENTLCHSIEPLPSITKCLLHLMCSMLTSEVFRDVRGESARKMCRTVPENVHVSFSYLRFTKLAGQLALQCPEALIVAPLVYSFLM